MFLRRIHLIGLALAVAASPAAAGDDLKGIEFFEKKIRPVLIQNCYECHSASAAKVKGGLLLDTRAGLRKGGKSGRGGVKGGMRYGATNDLGTAAAENRVHVNDLHATVLHLLGLDHTRLTYRYAGRDFRLTDVGGRVLRDILA